MVETNCAGRGNLKQILLRVQGISAKNIYQTSTHSMVTFWYY